MTQKTTYQELERRVKELEQVEFERRKTMEALRQRVKELKCLYGISHLVQSKESLPEILQGTVNLVPDSWQYPEVTACQITVKGNLFKSQNCCESCDGCPHDFLSQPIIVNGYPAGEIRVCYLEKKPKADEVPFLREERELINSIAERLGRTVERKQNEEELRRSQMMLTRTERIANIGSWEWEIATDTVTWSEGLYRIFQLDLAGKAPSWAEHPKLCHPEDFKILRKAVEKALSDGTPYELELRALRRDKEIRLCQVNGFVEFGSEGSPARLYGSFHDITERKRTEEELSRYRDHLEDVVKDRTAILARVNDQLTHEIEERKRAERALQESQQMLQSVLDTIPVRVFWKDLDSKYLGCNRAFAHDAGLQSPDEILGKTDFDMVWVEQAEFFRADDHLVMGSGEPKLAYEEPQTTPHGSRMWLLTNKVPLLDTEGRIKGVLGTYQDITESKQMEEALRASETKYRIVADNTYDWEYWVSAEGEFLYTSPSCQRITGYAASDFETDPKLLSRIVHPDDLTQFEAHVRKYKSEFLSSQLEFRVIRRDGMTQWIGHLCQPVFDAEGLFLGRRGSNRDITDQKEAAKALQESSQKLKLFAYSVVHDLKSPAIGIYGLTRRLCKNYRDILDEKGRNYCDQILRTAEHVAALVDKVNIYIATKESLLSIEAMKVKEIFRVVKDEFSAQLSIRQVDWIQPGTELQIKADRLSMLRAFRNLVDNSLKYGGDRLSKIWIGYEESQDFHIFSFSDDGRGLKEEVSEKIFRAFQRNETSRGVEGTGLGLAIVKEIAEQHGGKVWVEPRSSKGITFHISISKNL